MSYPSRQVLLLLVTLGVAACTTLTVEERGAACRATDWANYGHNDGVLGIPVTQRTEKFTDCAALGYPADVALYQSSRAEGLKTFCTVENGYEVGYAGRRYRGVCPPELAANFLQGYEQGRKEQPVTFYPYFGFGFGYSNFSYFNDRHHRHFGHRSHRGRGSQK